MGASCWTPLQGEKAGFGVREVPWDEGRGSCRLLCRKQAAQLALEARPALCAASLALGQSLLLSASLNLQARQVPLQKQYLASRGLAFTVPAPEESESLQGPFAC